jgi:acylglycerol lipase
MAMTGLAPAFANPSFEPRPAVSNLAELALVQDYAPAFDEPTPIALEHGETVVAAHDKTPLYTQRWRPYESRLESRGAVLVVHGLKDHSARYGAFAECLVDAGFAVHAFDLRGHARSGGARAWVDSVDDYLRDLDAMVRHVRWHEHGAGGDRLFLFGQGMGASLAALWATTRTTRLAGLMLSGAALQTQEEAPEASLTRLLAVLAPHTRILQTDLRRASRDRGTVEDSLRDALVHPAPAPARTARALLDAMEGVDAGAPRLDVPLLAMHGTADVLQDPEGSKRLVARAGSVDKQLYLYDGLAHDLLHEPERARVTSDIAAWLHERA